MKSFLIMLLVSIALSSYGQDYYLKGKIKESDKKEALVSANVLLTRKSDSQKFGTYSNTEDSFIIKKLTPAFYQLKISIVGYKSLDKIIEFKKENIDLGY
jgi:hypothetical protein